MKIFIILFLVIILCSCKTTCFICQPNGTVCYMDQTLDLSDVKKRLPQIKTGMLIDDAIEILGKPSVVTHICLSYYAKKGKAQVDVFIDGKSVTRARYMKEGMGLIVMKDGNSILVMPAFGGRTNKKKVKYIPQVAEQIKHGPNGIDTLSLEVDVKHLLSLERIDKLAEYVKVKDQNGKVITSLPVKDGTIRGLFYFSPNNTLELVHDKGTIPISEFIYHICKNLNKSIIPRKLMLPDSDITTTDDLILEELEWEKGLEAWSFHFRKKKENKTSNKVAPSNSDTAVAAPE